ncbi:MAG: tryptophanase [Sulfobacillus sp.]
MSQEQWSALIGGDESYAGSTSFQELQAAVQEVLGFSYLLAVHQGRAAEHVLFRTLVQPGQLVPNNMHFDTTKAHVLNRGAQPVDLVIAEGTKAEDDHPFKGNMDVKRLDDLLRREAGRVPLVMVTVTSNQNGGQPVSLANLQAVRQVCDRHGKPLFLDAARFAENAFFIQQRETGQAGRPVAQIVLDMMALADGCTMSAKKDPLVNIGGLLLMRDLPLFEALRTQTILYEGYATYGGLAGRDLAALAQGLRESVDEAYLSFRIGQVARLHAALVEAEVPVVSPAGGHGVYVDPRLSFHPSREGPFRPGHCQSSSTGSGESARLKSVLSWLGATPSAARTTMRQWTWCAWPFPAESILTAISLKSLGPGGGSPSGGRRCAATAWSSRHLFFAISRPDSNRVES